MWQVSLAWPDRFLGAGRYCLQYKRPRRKRVWPSSQAKLTFDTSEGVD